MAIGLVSILMVFGCPTLIVIGALLFRYRSVQLRHRERLAAMEKGVDLTTLALSDPFHIQNYRAYLLRGLLWLLAGVAITICLAVLMPPLFDGPRATALLGLIPVSVGLAYLIFYRSESQRAGGEEPQHETLSMTRP